MTRKNPKPSSPTKSSVTTAAPPPTTPSAPAAHPARSARNASALSVPGAAGIAASGQAQPTNLSLRLADDPTAPRCAGCSVASRDLWPVPLSANAEDTLVCSLRCLFAALQPPAERKHFLRLWQKAAALNPTPPPSPDTPPPSAAVAATIADLLLVGDIIAAQDEHQRARLQKEARAKLDTTTQGDLP